MKQRERPLSPHLQIYKFQYTMVLSFSHRIAGLFLSFGLLLFTAWLLAIAAGRDSYGAVQHVLSSPLAKLVWTGVVVSFCFHLANGVRHLVWDCGYGLEKRQARASGWTVVVVTVLLSALCLYAAWRMSGAAA
jgi:succinate dehydrogenase / fumarate reductase cytochrome b subunit